MKKYPLISLMAAVTALGLCGCGEKTPPESDKIRPSYKPLSDSSEAVKKAEAQEANAKKSGRPHSAVPAKQGEAQETTTQNKTAAAGSVSSVIDYATGKTQLSIKQSSEKKLNSIQDANNQSLKKALEEK